MGTKMDREKVVKVSGSTMFSPLPVKEVKVQFYCSKNHLSLQVDSLG